MKNLTSTNGGSIKLYAQWSKNAAIKKLSSSKKKTLTVSFGKVTNATGYRIRYSAAKNMKGAKLVTTKATKKTIKVSKSKKVFYVQVQSYRTIKGQKVYGPWSAKKK